MGKAVYPSEAFFPANTPLTLSHTPAGDIVGAVGSELNESPRSSVKILSFGRLHHLSVSELATTLTLEKAIAAPAIIGCKLHPSGRKKPIAKGIPRML